MENNKDIMMNLKEIDLTRTSLDNDHEEYHELCSELSEVQNLNDKIQKLLGEEKEIVETQTENIVQETEIVLEEIDNLKITDYKPILIGSTIGAVALGPVGVLMGLKYGAVMVALGGGLSGGLLGKYITS